MTSEAKEGARRTGQTQGPYRGSDVRTEAGENDGLVGDLVRQFADPYALFRELAQNAIDAGATEIHVRVVITREPSGHEARLSVTDDGCGMSQETLEEDLVVLFRSTKDRRDDAIGKFGVGFVSVLAIAPTLVVVSTCQGDAARHVLHLHPDRSYDLYREAGGTRGTTVTLHVPLEDDGSELVARSQAALERWCGHAGLPIHFHVVRASDAAPSVELRIDKAMEIESALVSVRSVSHDELTQAIVALVPETARAAAYYNRGLLLHESRDRGTRAAIAFKVSDRRLSHTLSREDVRLDEAHARAVRLVEHTIAVPLTSDTLEAIAEAASGVVRGEAGAGARWLALVSAARAAELRIDTDAIDVPILSPIGGRRVARCLAAGGPLLVARERDALVDLLAASGTPVIDGRIADDPAARATLEALVIAASGMPPTDPHVHHTALVPQPASEADRALLGRVAALFAKVLRAPSAVQLVDVIGESIRLSFALSGEGPRLALALEDEGDPFRLALRPPLGLSIRHPILQAAREHPDPILAADVIVRGVLAERGLSNEARSLALLEASLRAMFAEGGA